MTSFRGGSLFGFEIRIDYSWFVIFVLILWSFSAGTFSAAYPDMSASGHLLMGTAATVLFFASLVAHELAHALMARSRGYEMGGITLFIFGGIAHARRDATRPGDELVIAGVGPLSSLVIAGLFVLVAWLSPIVGLHPGVASVATQLAWLNLLLAGFNLLPGFPLDGGRIFRASAWAMTGSFSKATRWATTGGRWLGVALIVGGALGALDGYIVAGLWFVFVGWFLRSAAASSWKEYTFRRLLSTVPAQAMTRSSGRRVPPDITLQELVDWLVLRYREEAFPVVQEGLVRGLITLEHVRRIPREAWPHTTVGEVMATPDDLAVEPLEPLTRIVDRMRDTGLGSVLVADDGDCRGVITERDVMDWVHRKEEFGDKPVLAASAETKARAPTR